MTTTNRNADLNRRTLSDITQQYIKERDMAEVRRAILDPSPFIQLLMRNAEDYAQSGAIGSPTIPETPKGLNGPAGGSLYEECLATQGAVWPEPGAPALAVKPPLGPQRRMAAAEIPVTAEMIVAGVQANSSCSVKSSTDYTGIGAAVRTIYRAMAPLAPRDDSFETYAKAQFADGWKAERDNVLKIATEQAERINELEARIGSMFTFEQMAFSLGKKDTRIAELEAKLAAFTAANVPPAEPEHNPFREFPVDRRRIGG